MSTRNAGPALAAVFPDSGKAEGAVDELWHAGFTKDEVALAAPGEDLHQATTSTEAAEDSATEGAVAGALAGGTAGAVAGAIAAAAVPGLGIAIAGGALTSIALGAAGGAALGTFAGPFVALGLSGETAEHYERHYQAGRSIVVVQNPARATEALLILKKHGASEVRPLDRATA